MSLSDKYRQNKVNNGAECYNYNQGNPNDLSDFFEFFWGKHSIIKVYNKIRHV